MAATFKYRRPFFIIRWYYRIKWFLLWYKGLYVGSPWYKKTFAAIISLIIFFFSYLGAVDQNLFWLFGDSPGLEQIKHTQPNEGSVILSADAVQIGRYYDVNRMLVKYSEVDTMFWKALVDTEDQRFYDHYGIDPEGILGAMKDAATGRGGRGASTITQQLAKNLFRVRSHYSTGVAGKIPGFRLLIEKTKEWIIATKIELWYTYDTKNHGDAKQKILEMYANTVDYGNNLYGLQRASKSYFGKDPKDLSVDECALLVGVLKGTSLYNPRKNPEKAIERRNVVLSNMLTQGDITKDEYDTYSARDLVLKKQKEEKENKDKAPYFKDYLERYLQPLLKAEGYDLYTSGLTIRTTLDSHMQEYAEAAVATEMARIQTEFYGDWNGETPWAKQDKMLVDRILKKLPLYEYLKKKYDGDTIAIDNAMYRETHPVKLFSWNGKDHTITQTMSSADSVRYMLKLMRCSMVAMEPETGHVKAYVGGIDHNFWKYDAAQAQHQAGSTFKLFVYTSAMEKDYTPATTLKDEPFSVYDPETGSQWQPRNAGGSFSYNEINLQTAFARSINSISAKLGNDRVGKNGDGIRFIQKTAKNMGIKSKIPESPSITLGACDVSLMEMVNAYCTVANYGRHHTPVIVTEVLDANGETIDLGRLEGEEEDAIKERSAYYMQQLLMAGRKVAGGTSLRLNQFVDEFSDTDFGGKTGTTNNNSDGWYMCVSPKLVVGSWVGGEYRSIHFRSGSLGQGASTALPICGRFMQKVMRDRNLRDYRCKFEKPSISGLVDCPPINAPASTPQPTTPKPVAIINDSTSYTEPNEPEGGEGNAEPEQNNSSQINTGVENNTPANEVRTEANPSSSGLNSAVSTPTQ